MKIGRFANVVLLLLLFLVVALVELSPVSPRRYLVGAGAIADISGFLALGLIAATGVLMLFKGPLATKMGSKARLWRVHVLIAGAGGVFLGLHVALFFAFGLSLAVLFGYVATGAALFVWLTGAVYLQGLRGSAFLHGLFTFGAIFLSVVHTVAAGRNIPVELSGLSLAAIGAAVLASVILRLAVAWRTEPISGGAQSK